MADIAQHKPVDEEKHEEVTHPDDALPDFPNETGQSPKYPDAYS